MSNTQDSSNPTIHSPSSLLNFHHPSSFDTSPATTAELNHSTDTAKHTRNGTSADHPPRPLTKSPSFASRFGFSPKLPQYFPRRSWGPHPAHPGHQNGGSSVESGRTQNSSIPTDSQDSATCQPPPIERDSVDPPALPLKDRTARQNFSDHRDAGQQSHDQSSQDNDGDPQSQRAPRAARSFKRFFKSRSAKEREELEKDRQKRRRSLVELEGPSFDHPLRGTHSRGGAFTKNVARSLRSLNSQASQASVQSLVEAGRTAGSASKSSAIEPAAFLRAPAQPRLSSRPSVDSLSTSNLGNQPRHHLRTQSSTSSVDSSAPKSSIRSFGFNSSRSLVPSDSAKQGDQETREESASDSNHSQSSNGGPPRLAKTLWSNFDAEPSKRQLSPVLASPPPDSQPAGSLALSDSADVTPRPGNHLQQKPQEDKSPRPHPLAKTHSEPQVNADLQSIDDTAMVTKTNGDATKSGWKLPFARKVSSKSKRTEEEEEDDWDDYQRGTAAAPSRAVPSHAQKDAKLMAMLGLDNPRALHAGSETPTPTIGRRPKTGPSHDVMDDLRETGYLPRRPEPTPGGPGKGSHKLERLLGHEAGSSTPNLAPHTPHTSSSHSGLGHSDGRSSSHSVAPDSAGAAPTSHSTGSPHPGSSHMTSAGESSLHIAETDCPVCLEPLSYRLAGEKPHVIPNCGHALHNACFTAVYGQPEAILAQQGRNGGAGGGPPGMCGVCRKAIVLGGDIEGSNKGSKLAGMMGINEPIDRRRRESDLSHERTDAGTDDPLDSMGHSSFRGAARDQNGIGLHSSPSTRSLTYDTFDAPQQRQQAMVQPTIRVRPEYNTIYRKDPSGQNGKQNMVCVITIEIPSRRPPLSPEEEEAKFRQQWSSLQAIHDREEGDTFDDMDQSRNNRMSRIPALSDGGRSTNDVSGDYGDSRVDGDADGAADGAKESETGHSPNAPGSSHGRDEGGASSPTEEGFSFGATPAASDADPNAAVLEDLRQRIHDWKGQGIEKFGALVLYDSLGVRQDTVVRNFWVYLFHDVLLCITQERRKERGLARLMSGAAGSDKNGAVEDAGPHTPSSGPKPALKLKGRIWLRHIAKVKDNSVPGNYSLSIKLDDDSLDHFVLCLPDQPTLQIWKEKLTELVQAHKPGGQARPPATAPPAAPSVAGSSTSNNSNSTRQNLRELPSTRAATDLANHELPPPPPNANLTRRSTSGSASVASGKAGHSPQTAASQAMPNSSSASRRGNLADSIRRSSRLFSPSYSTGNSIPPQQQWSASGGLDPSVAPPHLLPHTPLDLVLMVSVPVVVQQQNTGVSSSAAMKLRLIRSVLEFVTSHMGPRDRVAIVAYTSGQEGEVRRTALLNVNRERSRAKLADFIECIGKSWDETEEDPFRVDTRRLGGASERTDTVTALNVGLDVVLGRKSKNPCTGMILINDTSDGPVRGHMDLVMARAEAANVPIHCFGFGKSSNPSSLWLISNHTRGSYTFVREWFQLRECVAGCIGSLMSVALDQVKLHISVPGDNHFRVRKLAGLQGAIVSSSGKDVDIELGELRFGEVKELFVELELDFNGLVPFIAHDAGDGRVGVRRVHNAPAIEAGSATDDFMQRLGLNNLSLAESSGDALGVDAIENLIEEVAVFEVDAGFRDPALNMSVTRLSNPTVLTMEVDAHNLEAGADGSPALPADPSVTRRRIEILASEMITRSLLLVSRKNYSAALRIVNETHKIVETVVRSLSSEEGFIANGGVNGNTSIDRRASTNSNGTYSQHGAGGRSKGFHSGPARQRAHLQRQAIASLLGIIEDLELMSDGLESGQRAQFDRDGRNSAAQQAMVLRDQQAWTTRSPTEALRFTSDNGPAFAAHAFAASRF